MVVVVDSIFVTMPEESLRHFFNYKGDRIIEKTFYNTLIFDKQVIMHHSVDSFKK